MDDRGSCFSISRRKSSEVPVLVADPVPRLCVALSLCMGTEAKVESSTPVAKCMLAIVSFIVSPRVSLKCESTMMAVGTMFCGEGRGG